MAVWDHDCACGSGEKQHAEYDARGIYLCACCSKCEAEKLRRYRPEVLSNPSYAYEGDIDPEPCVGGFDDDWDYDCP